MNCQWTSVFLRENVLWVDIDCSLSSFGNNKLCGYCFAVNTQILLQVLGLSQNTLNEILDQDQNSRPPGQRRDL